MKGIRINEKEKNLPRTLAVLGFVVSLLGIVLSAATNPQGTTTLPGLDLQLSATGLIGVLIAVAFLFAKNNVVEKIGYGILAINATVGIANISARGIELTSIATVLDLVVMILFLVSSVYYFVVACLDYFGYSKFGVNGKENTKLGTLKGWNKLVENNTLTNEEYDVVKKVVLKSDLSSKAFSELEDMRKLLEARLASADDLKAFVASISK
ncbi:hypothetical protein [Haploplasma axanthum]|uniref:Uncharacterized protein n=1 Tax=Haploplasma axanthum TaxID=29552 RepID=A0A449BDN2_HAPAX|nr:hypothetical protein [Haploplasma axanthum]VEU80564.1 Uncharacterised protein [Haploplasma axanthum]